MDLETASGPMINTQYLLTDNLGSVDVATDANGAVVSGTGFSFGAFGNRRDPASWQAPANNTQVAADRVNGTSNGVSSGVTNRGYTGHEMLDNVGLVHMNGRVYDPMLGRFLSVDPVFQFPTNTQSLNPYTYVLNNPLSATDPSGYTENCTAGQTTGCPPEGQIKSGDTARQTYTPTGSHIAVSVSATARSDGSVTISTNAGSKSQVADNLRSGTAAFGGGGNGEQNSQQGAGSTIATGKSQAAGTSLTTATQAASASKSAGLSDTSGRITPCADDQGCEVKNPYINNQWVNVTGGTVSEQNSVHAALDRIEDTPRGKELMKMQEGNGRVLVIRIDDSQLNKEAVLGTGPVTLNLEHQVMVYTTGGNRVVSVDRLVAHEIGHAITGIDDVGPGNMANIIANENPIVMHSPISEPARTRYDLVDQ